MIDWRVNFDTPATASSSLPTLALQKAKNDFDDTKAQFQTYAYLKIKREVQTEIMSMSDTICFPTFEQSAENLENFTLSMDHKLKKQDETNLYDIIASNPDKDTHYQQIEEYRLRQAFFNELAPIWYVEWLYDIRHNIGMSEDIKNYILSNYPQYSKSIGKDERYLRTVLKRKLKDKLITILYNETYKEIAGITIKNIQDYNPKIRNATSKTDWYVLHKDKINSANKIKRAEERAIRIANGWVDKRGKYKRSKINEMV